MLILSSLDLGRSAVCSLQVDISTVRSGLASIIRWLTISYVWPGFGPRSFGVGAGLRFLNKSRIPPTVCRTFVETPGSSFPAAFLIASTAERCISEPDFPIIHARISRAFTESLFCLTVSGESSPLSRAFPFPVERISAGDSPPSVCLPRKLFRKVRMGSNLGRATVDRPIGLPFILGNGDSV